MGTLAWSAGDSLAGLWGRPESPFSTHEVTCPSPACFCSGPLLSSSRPRAPPPPVLFLMALAFSLPAAWPADLRQLCTSVPRSSPGSVSFQFKKGLGPAQISPSLFVSVHTVTWERGQREIWPDMALCWASAPKGGMNQPRVWGQTTIARAHSHSCEPEALSGPKNLTAPLSSKSRSTQPGGPGTDGTWTLDTERRWAPPISGGPFLLFRSPPSPWCWLELRAG